MSKLDDMIAEFNHQQAQGYLFSQNEKEMMHELIKARDEIDHLRKAVDELNRTIDAYRFLSFGASYGPVPEHLEGSD